MKNKLDLVFFIALIGIIIISLTGCNSKHCIKYNNDKYGDFEYCFDNTKSEIEGVPVFTDEEKGESILGVDLGFLEDIGNTLQSFLKPGTLNYEEKTYSEFPISETRIEKINRLLNELKRRNINAKK